MAIFQKEIECMPREALTKLQSERLCAQVKRMYGRVEVFRQRMDAKGLKPEDIRGIGDLSLLPFSCKQDLRDHYPYGLFAVPMKEIARVHASSGTTGKKIVVGYTKNDLAQWAECMARQLSAAGADENSILQNCFGYGLFTGGLGMHFGAERIDATVIPISTGNTQNQIQTLIDFGADILTCTPSYALYLADAIEEMGVKDQLKLKAGVFGAEPWTEDMRRTIEAKLGIKAFDVYGLSEIMGPGVAYECEEQCGMHVCEDKFIPEIIDPDTGEPLPYGETGELVFTTLTKEGFPLIRYRTRDVCSLIAEPCRCGRTHIRMHKPAGRTDDMLIIRGVNVFPSQIEEVLLRVGGGVAPYYEIVVDRVNHNDTLDIFVEMNAALFADDVKSLETIEKRVVEQLRSVLGIGAKVHLVNPKSLARSEGKAKRVIDKRNLH